MTRDNHTAEELREVMHYNPETGVLRWFSVTKQHGKRLGSVAGNVNHEGYRRVRWQGKFYLGHRVCWCLYYGDWPTGILDHANGDRLDNRIANLRLCSPLENSRNRRSVRGAIPFKGVNVANGKYVAKINHLCRKCLTIGVFETAEDAAAAYDEAAAKFHGSFAATNKSMGLL